jgi:uncharacterized integral membrane protein
MIGVISEIYQRQCSKNSHTYVAIICGVLLIVFILIVVVVAAFIPGVIRVSTSGGRCWSIRSRSDWC